MQKSHAAGRASQPTPAQLKEFFAQVGSGRVNKPRLQAFLRDEPGVVPEQKSEPIHYWMVRHGFLPASYGEAVTVSPNRTTRGETLSFLRSAPDTRSFAVGKYRRPYVAMLNFGQGDDWVIRVMGLENVPEFQELAKELEGIYGVTVKVELLDKKPYWERF